MNPLYPDGPVVAVTGHRPNKIGGYGEKNLSGLADFAKEELSRIKPRYVITGMALGWDQAVAVACADLSIPFVAAVPCDGQDRTWPESSKAIYRDLIGKAAEVIVVSPGGYAGWKMIRRNRYMVDRAAAEGGLLLALWDGTDGGTASTVTYARERNVPIDNAYGRRKTA